MLQDNINNIKFVTLLDLKDLERKLYADFRVMTAWRIELQEKGENKKANEVKKTEDYMSARWGMISDLIEAIENNKDIKEL